MKEMPEQERYKLNRLIKKSMYRSVRVDRGYHNPSHSNQFLSAIYDPNAKPAIESGTGSGAHFASFSKSSSFSNIIDFLDDNE